MKQKLVIISIMTVIGGLILSGNVYAQNNRPSLPSTVQQRTTTITAVPTTMPTRVPATVLENMKLRASSRINERVAALEEVKAAILANTHLTAEQKSEVIARLDAAIQRLKNIHTTIPTKTTAEDVTTLFSNVIGEKVFSCKLPQVRLTTAKASLQNGQENLDELVLRLEDLITRLAAEGHDVTRLQAALATIKQKVTLVGEKLASAEAKLKMAENAPNCSQINGTIRTELTSIHALLASIRADIANLKAAFQRAVIPTTLPSVVPTSTSTPSASPSMRTLPLQVNR